VEGVSLLGSGAILSESQPQATATFKKHTLYKNNKLVFWSKFFLLFMLVIAVVLVMRYASPTKDFPIGMNPQIFQI
jgi:hypothetical protein